MTRNDELLNVVSRRGIKSEPFGYGIRPADVYVRTLQETIGLDRCYRYASQGNTSFNDVLRKAAKTLTYANPEMVVQEKGQDFPGELELPKNTLMAFRHVLTTDRKDRDGDVLHSSGADVDPSMLLLFQHVHTMPIGKLVIVEEKTASRLVVVSCVVDVNSVAHDAAVMIDNGMGRFSHGFRAMEFSEIKGGGFDVTKFEIMEESLVSVPANIDAATEDVLLTLVEGGKLTSPLLKDIGRGLRDRRPASVPVTIDLEGSDEKQDSSAGGRAVSSPEKADGGGDEGREEADEAGDQKASNVSLNGPGKANAAKLVTAGKVTTEGSWDPPSADDSDTFIEENGMDGYAKWFLGKRSGSDEETKAAWAYPFSGDFKNVSRPGLVAIRQRAGQQDETDIFEAAGELIEKIDAEKDADPQTKFYAEMAGSYESVIEKLREQVREKFENSRDTYVWIEATLPDYVLVCVEKAAARTFYKMGWAMEEGSPKLTGTQEEVEVNTSVILSPKKDIKAGRVLSKSNEGKIREARDDVDEARKTEMDRGAKALLKNASSNLSTVLDSLGPADEDGKSSLEDSMTAILLGADKTQRTTLIETLQMLNRAEERAEKLKRYRRFRRK